MAFKVLLGLLAAVAVSGTAAYYGLSSGPDSLPGGCSASACPVTACYDEQALAEVSSCCAAKSRGATVACCAEGEAMAAAGGDAFAAVTGGVTLGR